MYLDTRGPDANQRAADIHYSAMPGRPDYADLSEPRNAGREPGRPLGAIAVLRAVGWTRLLQADGGDDRSLLLSQQTYYPAQAG